MPRRDKVKTICKNCGEWYETSAGNSLYCSENCRTEANLRRKRWQKKMKIKEMEAEARASAIKAEKERKKKEEASKIDKMSLDQIAQLAKERGTTFGKIMAENDRNKVKVVVPVHAGKTKRKVYIGESIWKEK